MNYVCIVMVHCILCCLNECPCGGKIPLNILVMEYMELGWGGKGTAGLYVTQERADTC